MATLSSFDPLSSDVIQSEAWDVIQLRRSTTDVPDGPTGLQTLALQGSWRAVAERTNAYRNAPVDDLLVGAAWHIFALTKLRQYGNAADELASLSPLDSPQYIQEGPRGPSSKVPFALRWLQAVLPFLLGKQKEAVERTYDLLEFCRLQVEKCASGPDAQPVGDSTLEEDGAPLELSELWNRRQEMVVAMLVGHHTRAREYVVALRWLGWLLDRRKGDVQLLSKIGYVQLVLGDLRAAAASFQDVIRAVAAAGPLATPADRRLVRRNQGLLLFAEQDYKGAEAAFDAVLREDPGDYIAANNKSVCRMYACNLPGAVQSLEAALQANPQSFLQETVLLNLCSMYELSSSTASTESKRRLTAWASRVGPEDFDLSIFRPA
ncbi:Trafficking protein particle complex subunit 12 [Coccomyxa sp. Obi]|nr:Trafficking protein particle complex subunit 12 [Coccomyxa sp. Obi]